jgi:hypothetical protein
MRPSALLVTAVIAGSASAASAGPDGLDTAPTVIGVPTAWIQPAGAAHVSLDGDRFLNSGVRVTKSLSSIAEIDVASDDTILTCDPCRGDGRTTEGLQAVSGGFKLAAGEDAWFRHQPALAVGVNAHITARDEARAAQAYAVASTTWGPVRLHAGAQAWATEHRGGDGAAIRRGDLLAVRPMAGLAWTPYIYPRTILQADFQWVPELGPTAAETDLRWLFAWGARYRAFRWGAIEFAVKHREGEKIGDAAVMIRLTARLGKGTRL